jgi:hypothetical protein
VFLGVIMIDDVLASYFFYHSKHPDAFFERGTSAFEKRWPCLSGDAESQQNHYNTVE